MTDRDLISHQGVTDMAKSAGSGKCVHCLRDVPELTWDHIFPVSWYPETTPRNIAKWKAPSCAWCNKHYGVLEQDLLICLGLCVSPYDEKSKGIAQKALRSIDPRQTKNHRDAKARENAVSAYIATCCILSAGTHPRQALFCCGDRRL